MFSCYLGNVLGSGVLRKGLGKLGVKRGVFGAECGNFDEITDFSEYAQEKLSNRGKKFWFA